MKCDICRERKAVLFVQQVSRGATLELHLCENCARERGYQVNENRIDISLGGLFSGILKSGDQPSERESTCPACGLTLKDIRKTHRVGCPDCYREFKAEITALLRNEGIEPSYTGMLPPKLEPFRRAKPDPENLKKELQHAIEIEDYELAAYYRDRLRALGGSA
jgi:protein arginine kinase activator